MNGYPSWVQSSEDEKNLQLVKGWGEKLKERLYFSSDTMPPHKNYYVAWIDLMGAGNLMSVSVAKTANAVARLHMAVQQSCDKFKFDGEMLSINDGVFLLSKTRNTLCNIIRLSFLMLGSTFILSQSPAVRFMYRGAIAFGPVVSGAELACGLSKKKIGSGLGKCLERTMIGSPVIQAYQSETNAPPFGVAVHESARAFSPNGEKPFQTTHWLWWILGDGEEKPNEVGDIGTFKNVLSKEIVRHIQWLEEYELFNKVPENKTKRYASMTHQYFSVN